MHKTNAPTRTDIALWVVGFAIAISVALWWGAGRADAAPPLCDNSECTITVPPSTTPPGAESTTTAAPTTTTAVPSTTTQPPAPSTSTTTTVAVGPPPVSTMPPKDDDVVVIPPGRQACVIRTGPESAVTYVWYYLTPPTNALYSSGSQALEPFAPCYVPRPSSLPVTGADHRGILLAALFVGLAGGILLAVSRRKVA